MSTARNKQRTAGGTLGEHLVAVGAVSDEALTEFYRSRLMVPQVSPTTLAKLPDRVVDLFPSDMAVEFRAVPVALDRDGNLTVAMSDPSDRHAVDEIGFFTGKYVVRAVATQMQIAWCLAHYYDYVTELGERLMQPVPMPAAMIKPLVLPTKPAPAVPQAAPITRAKGDTAKVQAARHRVLVPATVPPPMEPRPGPEALDRVGPSAGTPAALAAAGAAAPAGTAGGIAMSGAAGGSIGSEARASGLELRGLHPVLEIELEPDEPPDPDAFGPEAPLAPPPGQAAGAVTVRAPLPALAAPAAKPAASPAGPQAATSGSMSGASSSAASSLGGRHAFQSLLDPASDPFAGHSGGSPSIVISPEATRPQRSRPAVPDPPELAARAGELVGKGRDGRVDAPAVTIEINFGDEPEEPIALARKRATTAPPVLLIVDGNTSSPAALVDHDDGDATPPPGGYDDATPGGYDDATPPPRGYVDGYDDLDEPAIIIDTLADTESQPILLEHFRRGEPPPAAAPVATTITDEPSGPVLLVKRKKGILPRRDKRTVIGIGALGPIPMSEDPPPVTARPPTLAPPVTGPPIALATLVDDSDDAPVIGFASDPVTGASAVFDAETAVSPIMAIQASVLASLGASGSHAAAGGGLVGPNTDAESTIDLPTMTASGRIAVPAVLLAAAELAAATDAAPATDASTSTDAADTLTDAAAPADAAPADAAPADAPAPRKLPLVRAKTAPLGGDDGVPREVADDDNAATRRVTLDEAARIDDGWGETTDGFPYGPPGTTIPPPFLGALQPIEDAPSGQIPLATDGGMVIVQESQPHRAPPRSRTDEHRADALAAMAPMAPMPTGPTGPMTPASTAFADVPTVTSPTAIHADVTRAHVAPPPPAPPPQRHLSRPHVLADPAVAAKQLEEASLQLVDLLRGLDSARTRDHVIAMLIDFVAASHHRAAFLAVKPTEMTAFMQSPPPVTGEPSARLDLTTPSTFQDVVGTRLPYRGPIADGPSRELVKAMFGSTTDEMLAVPVAVRERVVGIVYADGRYRHSFDEHVTVGGRAAGLALERILKAKPR